MNNQFNKILQWFQDNMNTICVEDTYNPKDYVVVQTQCTFCLIVSPHKDLESWMLRIALRPTFDRWANSTVMEIFFNNEDEIIDYLEDNQLKIYKTLLEDACEELEEFIYV